MHLKIRRRDGVESLTILEEGEFKLAIDGCISAEKKILQADGVPVKATKTSSEHSVGQI